MYPLHYALCFKSSLEVVATLSARCPEHLTHRDRRGRMPLHYGLEKGCSEGILLFLVSGVFCCLLVSQCCEIIST